MPEILEEILLTDSQDDNMCEFDSSKENYGLSIPLNQTGKDGDGDLGRANCNPALKSNFIDQITEEQAQQEILGLLKPISISSLKDLKSTTSTVVHSIKLKPDAIPVKQKERRIAHHYIQEFEQIIDDMLESGKIQPTHTSPWA